MSLTALDFHEDLILPSGIKIDGVLKRVDAYMPLYNDPEFIFSRERCPTCNSRFSRECLCMRLWSEPTSRHPYGIEELLIPCLKCEKLSIFNRRSL